MNISIKRKFAVISAAIATLVSVVGSASALTIPRPISPIKDCPCMGNPPRCLKVRCPKEFTLAKKEADEGGSRFPSNEANPIGSQPAPGEDAEAFRRRTGRGDGRSPAEVGPARGAGGRDAEQKEKNLESGHRGFGGPQ